MNTATIFAALSADPFPALPASFRNLPDKPLSLDPEKAFKSLVEWTTSIARSSPGFVMGLDGTDSILTFLICSKAFERLGRSDRLVGIHYGRAYEPSDWLSKFGQVELVQLTSDPNYLADSKYWAALQNYALKDWQPEKHFWVTGTRNRTEDVLYRYSNASMIASVQPIVGLWKTEVLELCDYLGVPKSISERSREVPACLGCRDEFAAKNIDKIDHLLMVRCGLLDPTFVAGYDPRLTEYIDEQIEKNSFKVKIPYRPEAELLSSARRVAA